MLARGKKVKNVAETVVEEVETETETEAEATLDNVKSVVVKNATVGEYKVTKRYEKHTSFMVGTYILPVKDGKVRCSGKVKEMLLKGGFIVA